MTQQLLCPHDNTPLTMQTRFDIEVDICSQCRGMWLERDELDKILRASRGELPRKDTVVDSVADVATLAVPSPRGGSSGGSDVAATVADFFEGLFS